MQILVLGMHRSGTSVVSRLLNMMGVYFAPEGASTGANQENPKGFWERRDVRNLNDMLLQSAGCDWDRVGSFDPANIPGQNLADFKKEAGKIILAMDAYRPWFLKEPRFCVLLPFWLELLECPICLHVYRSPVEIAKSLQMRNSFSLSFGLALWEKYVVDALNASAGRPSLLIHHADLLAQPVEATQKILTELHALGVRGLREPSVQEITAFIDVNLHRARTAKGEEAGLLTPSQNCLMKSLQKGILQNPDGPWVLSEAALDILLRTDRDLSTTREIQALQAINLELTAQTEELQKQIASLQKQGAEQQKLLLERTRQMEVAQAREQSLLEASRQQSTTLLSEIDALRQIIQKAASDDLIRAREENVRLQTALNSLEAEKIRRAGELQLQKDTAATLQAEKIRLAGELQLQKTAAANLNKDLAGQTNSFKEKIQRASARILSLEQSVHKRDEVIADKNQRLNALKKEFHHYWKTTRDLEKHFAVLRKSKSFRFLLRFARSLGLISRTPRRSIEAMERQLGRLRSLSHDSKSSIPAVDSQKKKSPNNHDGPAQLLTGAKDQPANPLSLANPDAALKRITLALANRTRANALHGLPVPDNSIPTGARICLIVLHRSGEHHLRNLFDSFLGVNSHRQVEFRIVLHACTDQSREVIAHYQKQLSIQVEDEPVNHSFSYSNNRAVEKTDAEYLAFLNNDIIFNQDVLPGLLQSLQIPGVGLVGLRLNFPADHAEHPGGIQHLGTKLRSDPEHFFHRPFNLGAPVHIASAPATPEIFPAVTAALAMCRRADFLQMGGFHEGYLYGYEDVDLCFTFRRLLGLRSLSANQLSCIHNESATGRMDATDAVRARRLSNIVRLAERHGWWMRRKFLADHLAGRFFYSEKPLVVAFAVTEADDNTAAGDYFTARELGDAAAKEFGWKIKYLARNKDWYDLKDVDVVIAMVDAYDLAKITRSKAGLLKIAWMRNWFERWAERPGFDYYDIFLCSSEKASRWLRGTQGKAAWTLPLATNGARFQTASPEKKFASDYCFTGSYWNADREIATAVQPERLPQHRFALFGKGWETHPAMSPYARGFQPYAEMPGIYASTRLVVDDANHVTKGWGSVNSRVFDALAAGALVVTNGAEGAGEMFGSDLPHYHNPEELHSLLQHYLENEPERLALADRLRSQVLSRHTYKHRARTLKSILLATARKRYRVAFKIGSPNRAQMHHWGDYHFALSLGRAMAAQGHSFRIDCLDEWDHPAGFGSDIVIVLRGLSRYTPKPGQINLMWNISHPDKITDEEYEQYDHVFVASDSHAERLQTRLKTGVSSLLQCTDPAVFYPDPHPEVPAEEILFVGNSRKNYREIVRLCVEAGMPVAVYGTHWPMFIPSSHIRGEHIENSILRQHYSRCDILLNDHWPSMRENGFISNRLFDAAAAGAFVISDAVTGQETVFGNDLVTYRSDAEFLELIEYFRQNPGERQERAQRLRERVLAGHTFASRAGTVLARIEELDSLLRGADYLKPLPQQQTAHA